MNTGRTPDPRRDDDSGAVAIIFALSVVVFVAILAITVDIARLRAERAHAQGAADNAAQSAAWAKCKGKTDAEAVAAGQSIATANGFTATVQKVSDNWRASIDTTLDRAVGAGNMDLRARAEAIGSCPPSTPLPALHAGSTTCGDKTFEWSGSGNTVNGDIHSNDEIKFGGSNVVNGDGTYVDKAIDPTKITWNPSALNPSKVPVQPFPTLFDINDYAPTSVPGGTRTVGAANNFYANTSGEINQSWLTARGLYSTTTKLITPGTYYASGGFDLGSMSGAHGQVTLVTPRQIKISPSNVNLRSFEDGLLLFSDYYEAGKCDVFGIDISGSNNYWGGIVYAPRAQVKYAGSSGFTLEGSIVANTIALSGSGFTLTSQSSGAAHPISILLMK